MTNRAAVAWDGRQLWHTDRSKALRPHLRGGYKMPPEPLLILLAEDDDGHAVLMQRGLARAGVTNELVRVRTGQEALDFLHLRGPFAGRRTDRPLLLLLGVTLPEMGGAEVLRRAKADPRHSHT